MEILIAFFKWLLNRTTLSIKDNKVEVRFVYEKEDKKS